MMYGPGYGFGGGSLLGMGLMMIFGLLFLAGFVLLIVWLVRSASGPETGHGPGGPGPYRSGTQEACDVARMRYARGEITKEQFEEICRTLGG